jgi:hypothetical protein
VDRRLLAETPVASVRPAYKSDKSATRTDIALLISALFLQRFAFHFGHTFLGLGLVPIGLILLHQFLHGKLLIQYDRLLWFLALALAATCSLLLNFRSTTLTSFFLFIVLYSLTTLNRPSTLDQYKGTLQAFQFLVMLLSCLGVAQFVAQFVVNGKQLTNFYGIVPDLLLDASHDQASGTIRTFGSGIIKSNGMFLSEPSTLSQITVLGILIEVSEFNRPRCLLVMTLGFLVAYSGTGLMSLLIFLPLAGLRHGRAGLSTLLVVVFIIGLFATGIFHLSVFTSRVDEFNDPRASGFERFVGPLWLAVKHLDTGSLQSLLVGSGPGTVKTFGDTWYTATSPAWFKVFYEYGIIGSFVFVCLLASCLRRSRCRGLVLAAMIFHYLFLTGGILDLSYVTIMIVLCTLHGPEPRRGRSVDSSQYRPSVVAGSVPG